MRPADRLSRRTFLIGACVAAVIGLGATAWGVFSPTVLEHYSASPDSVAITEWAERAERDEMVRWLHGQWIQACSPPYYRPLSSYLFFLEYRLFGWNFQGHVIVSWLAHAAICVCVYLLALRLIPGRFPLAMALLAVALFNLRLGPEGPDWEATPVAAAVVAWWPSQTDQMSLLPSLLALLALDRWLMGGRRRNLAAAVGLWLAALLFKEMAITLPVVAMLLVIYRGGRRSLAAPETANDDADERSPRGLAWLIGGGGIVAAAGYLALRSRLVEGGPDIFAHDAAFYLNKAMHVLFYRPYAVTVARWPWIVVAAILCAIVIMAWVRARQRPSWVWLIPGLIVAAGVPAELLAYNFFLITIPREIAALFTMTTLALGDSRPRARTGRLAVAAARHGGRGTSSAAVDVGPALLLLAGGAVGVVQRWPVAVCPRPVVQPGRPQREAGGRADRGGSADRNMMRYVPGIVVQKLNAAACVGLRCTSRFHMLRALSATNSASTAPAPMRPRRSGTIHAQPATRNVTKPGSANIA
ncbi:MAG: hypothetical protein ACOX9R_12365 [Armatimonadota bacterium]